MTLTRTPFALEQISGNDEQANIRQEIICHGRPGSGSPPAKLRSFLLAGRLGVGKILP